MPLKVIFFDAAGTLIHTAEPVGVTYAAFARRHGISVDAEAVRSAFSRAWSEMSPPGWNLGHPSPDDDRSWWHAFVRRCFALALDEVVPDQQMSSLFEDLYEHFARHEAWKVYSDVKDALRTLSADHRLLVVSNFDGRLRRILRDLDLDHWFSDLIISSEVGFAKPDPAIFWTALKVAGCQPSEALHIGDDERFDVIGPQAVGIHCFSVQRPLHGLDEAVEKVRQGAFPACVPRGSE